jgi:hypothetical protein
MVCKKSLKRDRSELSFRRYNKMKNLILVEVQSAIQEAELEQTASKCLSEMFESKDLEGIGEEVEVRLC